MCQFLFVLRAGQINPLIVNLINMGLSHLSQKPKIGQKALGEKDIGRGTIAQNLLVMEVHEFEIEQI